MKAKLRTGALTERAAKGGKMRIWRDGPWRLYWGALPIPYGYTVLGVVERTDGDTGVLMLTDGGMFVQGNAGAIRSLDQKRVIKRLSIIGQWGWNRVSAGWL